jgi:hypothetical protein
MTSEVEFRLIKIFLYQQPSNLKYTCHVRVGGIEYKSNGSLGYDGSLVCELKNMVTIFILFKHLSVCTVRLYYMRKLSN